jgi:plastocyanin
MQLTRLACLTIVSALIACGGGDDGGGTTNPPPPPPPGGNQTLGSIQTNVTTLNLGAGNTQTITVTAYDTQNAIISNPGSPTFTSSAAAIAEVDGSGTVTGISSGTANINVSLTVGSVTRTATVAVTVTGSLPSTANVSTTNGDAFTPNKVLIGIGGVVRWTFGVTIHNVTFQSSPGAPTNIADTYSISVDRTFAQSGNYNYQCTIHAGMNGQVVVR